MFFKVVNLFLFLKEVCFVMVFQWCLSMCWKMGCLGMCYKRGVSCHVLSKVTFNLLSEQFSGLHPAFETTLKYTGGYQNAGTSSLNSVTGRIFIIINNFIEASKNFISISFTKSLKRQQNIVKPISAHSILIFRTLKKYIHLVTFFLLIDVLE
jgi:hypothetical protein